MVNKMATHLPSDADECCVDFVGFVCVQISIVPRTNSALGFTQYMPSDQKLYSTEEVSVKRIAEYIFH